MKSITFAILFLFVFVTQSNWAQGLPSSGDSKLLFVFVKQSDTSSFNFKTSKLPGKVKDFYTEMSLGRLNLIISCISIVLEKPEQFYSYKEANQYVLEYCEEKIDLTKYSTFDDKTVLEGICIIYNDFYSGWKDNPTWSGLSTILIPDQTQRFDGKFLEFSSYHGKTSGLMMKASYDFDYSFWILVHEIGHLLSLKHLYTNKQLPYYILMNPTGEYWGVNRGMAFWEREFLGWAICDNILDLSAIILNKGEIAFTLPDYMTTGKYGKIILPKTEIVQYGEVQSVGNDALYFVNRQKISSYDQEKDKGDKGIFIFKKAGQPIHADNDNDYSQYPTNDAFGAPKMIYNEYEYNYDYKKIISINSNNTYQTQEYSLNLFFTFDSSNTITLKYSITNKGELTSTSNKVSEIHSMEIFQNFPNPFYSLTNISFYLANDRQIELKIYDVTGKEIIILAEGYFEKGMYNYQFDASNLASGIYIANLKSPFENEGEISKILTKKMLHLK